ncbi:MAG: hypothetical protein R3D34_04915 [Nitratireductor sp.]
MSLSTQHLDGPWDSKKVRSVVEPYIREALAHPAGSCCRLATGHNNPTGRPDVIASPDGNNRIFHDFSRRIVETYGGSAPHIRGDLLSGLVVALTKVDPLGSLSPFRTILPRMSIRSRRPC